MVKNKIFEFKSAKQSMILGVALLISFLINLPRILALYELVGESWTDSFPEVTVKDILLRLFFISIYSWLLLQINTNWKVLYSNLSMVSRSLLRILANLIMFVIAVHSFIFLDEIVTGKAITDLADTILHMVYAVIMIIVVFISRIIRLRMAHRVDLAEKELLKQQSLKNELDALKNQINPHFLFNSLNSLNSLVRDNKQATTFVNKLSFMYRYILQSGSEDLVTLKDELKFLDSYIFLIKTRYRSRFEININIDDEFLNKKLPSLALQLLVENAVKHSEISESNPLLVKVYIDEGFVAVENRIKPRTTFVDSTGNGLSNLDKRYEILMKTNIIISNANEVFKVKLPLK
ncbi:sensor histidine kinase [uncultured Algibacter sp.]|uniref:sensor histidine kinase n=1 Tax=uncultured Algibacter sp. TaxID=298659 RepID=UPI0026287ACE|nr:histidine kinase [uncultured Algibacter sp.]